MSRVEVTQVSTPLSDGILQTDLPIDATPQVVKDQLGNSSTLLLANDETQINSTLRVHTDSAELLDLEDTGNNNRFNINRDVQKINLDFASKPSDLTTQVGAIRTAQDGVNLSDTLKFQENGQVTFTERVKLESDSTVATQTSSVIQSTTTNANLVISPNGTGALVANIPDGTTTGGNARGNNAVDLQTVRDTNAKVASGLGSTISGGSSNTASSNYSTISGGQSNTASTNQHATVIGGQSNTSTGEKAISGGGANTSSGYASVALGYQNTASSSRAVAIGNQNVATGASSFSIGDNSQATNSYTTATGFFSLSYLPSQFSNSGGRFASVGDAQQSLLIARQNGSLTTGATMILSLDGTGVTNLIIPTGTNRMWNVQVGWVAVVTGITGTATGVTVGDTKSSTDLLLVAKRGGVTSVSAHTSAGTQVIETLAGSLTAANIAYSAGASQEMRITFTGPTFAGGGSVAMRVVARILLTEVAY